jgi:threonyl-tRNA synthetase
MDNRDLKVLRHSAAHLLAHAVSRLFTKTLFTIGPATENGFFYDVLPEKNFKEEDLITLEAEMHRIKEQNFSIEHKEILKEEARKLFANNPFKLELIDEIPGNTVGIATQGEFVDLCRGGHVAQTGDIQFFKLLAISGSYWRADRNNQALQRISGTAFYTKEALDAFLQHQQDLIQYDHRRLGKELDFFSFHQEGVGFPFFHPKGKAVLNVLVGYIRSLLFKYNYQEITTPVILSEALWHQSGHFQHYKDFMYFTEIDGQAHAIRPMNCPGSILLYKERPRSYRELPLKLAEFGLVHRHELSGVLHGLLRVRSFTQDDGHIFCTKEQIEALVIETIEFVSTVMQRMNFQDIAIGLSTKPEHAMGTDEQWEYATNALKNALLKAGKQFTVYDGEGAFYGPKIEFGIKDSMGRTWQCGTIQLDFSQPENFSLEYVDHTGSRVRPVMIHRAILGSLERFFAILLEHYKGLLPFWLSPIQARILTITDKQMEYAQLVYTTLKDTGFRVEVDQSSDPISGKIKTAQREKIPWMIIIGDKEVQKKVVTIRARDGSQQTDILLSDLVNVAKAESKKTT